MQSSQITIQALFVALKKYLKAQNLTYRDLGQRTKRAESSIKRIFSKAECSTGVFAELCDAAGISLIDLIKAMEVENLPMLTLSNEADQYFAENIDAFYFFSALQRTRNIEAAATQVEIDMKKARTFMVMLEKLKLLERHAKGRIRFLVGEVSELKISPDGPLRKKYLQSWIPRFLSFLLEPKPNGENGAQSRGVCLMAEMDLLPASIGEFNKEFENLGIQIFKKIHL